MKLFIQDKPIRIVRVDKLKESPEEFDLVLDGRKDAVVGENLKGDVLVRYASAEQIFQIFLLIKGKRIKKLDSIVFSVNDPESASHFIKKKFDIVKAAGGLVTKDGKILMIHRLKKWDLPKGKLEKGEPSLEGARREVEEECNIKVGGGEKICSTWHSYIRNGKHMLKKTYWYQMECLDDSNIRPQIEEDITEVRWMEHHEWKQALYNSYSTIRFVFTKYHEMEKKKL
jgi:8-oxo-(d)GTP phosphatase